MRHWNLPNTHNVRDLGGYALPAGGTTKWRRILRADNLHHLDEQSRRTLTDAGLRLVVDLRNDRETSTEPNPFREHPGLAYVNVSLFGALAPIAMLDTPFDMAARYRDALDQCGEPLVDVLGQISAAPDGMVIFHCTAGKDRTGVVAALILSLAGVSDEDIIADYALTVRAVPLLQRLRSRSLAMGADPVHIERVLASDAATMALTLRHLHRIHGGPAAYLQRHGLSTQAALRLVERLCQ